MGVEGDAASRRVVPLHERDPKIAPADARTARGPSGSAHSGERETAAPKASAVRISVPTFPDR